MESKPFSIRKNYILLLLLAIFILVNLCWFLIVGPVAIWGDVIFQEKSELFLDIFMVFIFPIFLGLFGSVITVAFSVIVRQKWWISVPLSLLFLGMPYLGYLITWLVSWPVRLVYLPTPQDEARTKKFLSFSVSPVEENSENDKDVQKIIKMKQLLDSGALTEQEFSAYKQQILFAETRKQQEQSLQRYFSIWQATIAAAMGGFIAGALMIAINAKRMSDKDQFRNGLIFGLIGHFISILISVTTSVIYTGLNPWLNVPFALVYPIVIYLWYNESQKKEISALFENKQARKESWGIAIGIVLASIAFIFVTGIPVALIVAILTAH